MTESHFVEFKEIVSQSAIKEIIAFANTDGGKLYIGINDQGGAVGLSDPKAEIEKISSMIHDGIRPSILNYIQISTTCMDEKDIIVVEVQRGGMV